MSLKMIFNPFAGVVGGTAALVTMVSAEVFGTPIETAAVMGLAAGGAAGLTSGVLYGFIGSAYNGKGGGAAVAGLFLMALTHATVVPLAALETAHLAYQTMEAPAPVPAPK